LGFSDHLGKQRIQIDGSAHLQQLGVPTLRERLEAALQMVLDLIGKL
jgi:hypothetical protein